MQMTRSPAWTSCSSLSGVREKSLRGFSSWEWSSGGLRYLLVGDVTGPEMGALARRMAESAAP